MTDERHNAPEMGRRAMLRTAGAAVITGLAVGGTATAAAAAVQDSDGMSAAERNEAPLGARLQGVQHFGLTVQNMERAYEFYTAVLGGTEVFRHGDFQGDGVQNTLLADQEIEANARGVNPRTIGVPDLRGGAQRLDVRFIQFDNVVIELLQYRDADQPMGSSKSFAEPVQHMSPAFPRMMHICFYVRDDVDFNKFIADLEAEFRPPRHDAGEGEPHGPGHDRGGPQGRSPQRQHEPGDRGAVGRLGTDLLQGSRRRATRVRESAGPRQEAFQRGPDETAADRSYADPEQPAADRLPALR